MREKRKRKRMERDNIKLERSNIDLVSMGKFDADIRCITVVKTSCILVSLYSPSSTYNLYIQRIFCKLSMNLIAKWFQYPGNFPLPPLITDTISFHSNVFGEAGHFFVSSSKVTTYLLATYYCSCNRLAHYCFREWDPSL